MSYDLVIKHGAIVTAENTYRADIGIKGERIAAIGENLAGAAEIDATGKLVTPGAIDVHVHLRDRDVRPLGPVPGREVIGVDPHLPHEVGGCVERAFEHDALVGLIGHG